MSAQHFIFVTGSSLSREHLDAYLYGHTEIEQERTAGSSFYALLVTTAEDARQAAHLADYQANRLASGLFGAATGADHDALVAEANRAWRITEPLLTTAELTAQEN